MKDNKIRFSGSTRDWVIVAVIILGAVLMYCSVQINYNDHTIAAVNLVVGFISASTVAILAFSTYDLSTEIQKKENKVKTVRANVGLEIWKDQFDCIREIIEKLEAVYNKTDKISENELDEYIGRFADLFISRAEFQKNIEDLVIAEQGSKISKVKEIYEKSNQLKGVIDSKLKKTGSTPYIDLTRIIKNTSTDSKYTDDFYGKQKKDINEILDIFIEVCD
jgi:hypothetical protein